MGGRWLRWDGMSEQFMYLLAFHKYQAKFEQCWSLFEEFSGKEYVGDSPAILVWGGRVGVTRM